MLGLWLLRVLGYFASLLGLLPVRGWPLQPRPWPSWAAILAALTQPVAFAVFVLLTHGRLRCEAIPMMAAFVLVGERVPLVRGRHALCEAMQCLLLYCRRHPVPARGWRWMLALTLAIIALRFVHCIALVRGASRGPEPNRIFLALAMTYQCTAMSLTLLALCPVALVGVLLEDLHHDVTLLLRGSRAATDVTRSQISALHSRPTDHRRSQGINVGAAWP